MTQQAKDWFTEKRIAWLVFTFNVLFVAATYLLSNNDIKNIVATHEKRLNDMDLKLTEFDKKKVDKETFNLLISTLTDLRADIRALRAEKSFK